MKGIKIANPGINALTDTNPKNFSLYVDGTTDHVLIKEFTRNTVSITSFTTHEVSHNLGYLPNYMVLVQIGSEYQWVYGLNAYNPFRAWASTTKLFLQNSDSSSRTFAYYIFYDQL